MSKGSIYDKNWLDLVFDGKNKAYGAYQLRQENEKTTVMAFLSGLGFFAGIAGVGMLISSFNSTEVINNTPKPEGDKIHVTQVHLREKPPVDKPKTTAESHPEEAVKPNLFNRYIPVETPLAQQDVPVTNDIKPEPGSTSNNGTATGTGTLTDPTAGTLGTTTTTGTEGSDTVTISVVLDKQPQFPGGINKFYEYIADNIQKPEGDGNANSINVIMSFVVEKDGSMTDIKVLRSSDKELEKAAVKVLKSLKTKWVPGILNGQPVRTQYVQPIRVNLLN
ncbi:energy transducer TonB [Flavobacterium sp. XGLA_31]|uniref:energy transducer TonB n=1 Tax=Flavobacterium sp. XGLA_31 TaxID=3447666 RepID=UPI003F340C54